MVQSFFDLHNAIKIIRLNMIDINGLLYILKNSIVHFFINLMQIFFLIQYKNSRE